MDDEMMEEILREEIAKVIEEQFNIPGVNWGQRRKPYQADQRGADLDLAAQEIGDMDASAGLNKGQRKAYNAAVSSSSEDTKKQVDALRADLTGQFREAITTAIDSAITKVVDPEVDEMRSQFSEMFQLVFDEIQREFKAAQDELDKRMQVIASQYLMKRDALRVAKKQFSKMQGSN